MTNLIPLRVYLQLEGAATLCVATFYYAELHLSWWTYAILFLVPDLSLLGYFINKRIGALIYNLGHTYVVPALLMALGSGLHEDLILAVGIIWCAHIGFDRVFGVGLKDAAGFKVTHFQKLGW